MHSYAILIAVAYLWASGVSAANTVKFVNWCPHNLYFWVVSPLQAELDHAYIAVPGNGGSIIHDMKGVGGVSLKIRDLPHYRVAPSGILQAEYNLEAATNSIWYDFSAIDCDKNVGPEHSSYCPFIRGGVKMYVPGADERQCPIAQCLPGTGCQDNVYQQHGFWPGEPSWRCHIGYDVLFETCTHESAPQTQCPDPSHHHDPPLPPPAPAPVVPEPEPELEPCPSSPPASQWIATPQTFPVPEHLPQSTTCYDEQCHCYDVAEEDLYLYPAYYPYDPYCPWGWPYPQAETNWCERHSKCRIQYGPHGKRRVERGLLGQGQEQD